MADAVRRGRPWSLPLEDRALLVAAYWRTNLTMRQLAPLFGISKSAAGRMIVDGTLVPTHDHTIAERSKNYWYSTNHQVVIDADTRLVVVVGQPLPGNRNDCKAWEESGAKAAIGKTLTIADGGYPGTGLAIPHRQQHGQTELPAWKEYSAIAVPGALLVFWVATRGRGDSYVGPDGRTRGPPERVGARHPPPHTGCRLIREPRRH